MGKVFHVCYVCKKRWGEPMEWPNWPDETETHGICEACRPGEIERVRKQIEELKKQNDPDETQAM